MKFLLANEFGGGSGHFLMIKGIMTALKAYDPEADFRVLMPLHYKGRQDLLERVDFRFPSEIAHFAPTKIHKGLTNFGEIMGSVLFEPTRPLSQRFSTWAKEIKDFKPDVIIADYAPTLLMYAWSRVPTLHIGVGYTMPPPEPPRFPDFRRRVAGAPMDDAELLERINAELKNASTSPLECLPHMNRANDYGLATIPIFDPYWQNRKQEYIGVYHPSGTPEVTSNAEGVLAYFSDGADHAAILDGLAQTRLEVQVYFAASNGRVLKSPSDNVRIFEHPFKLVADMPGKAVALHAGSLGFASAAMFAGVPQVSLFDHDERQCNAIATLKARIGLALPRQKLQVEQLSQRILEVNATAELRHYSVELSRRYASFRQSNPPDHIAKLALKLV